MNSNIFEPKKGFLERLGQSVKIFLHFGIKYGALFFCFQLVFIYIIPLLVFQVGIKFFPFEKINTHSIGEYIGLLIVFFISLWIIFFTIYLFFLTIIQFTLYKNLHNISENREFSQKENLVLGFQNISGIFRIYWYIFEYRYLYPLLGGIIGLLTTLAGTIENSKPLIALGIGISLFFIFFGIIFGVYRGIKSSFSMIHAVQKMDFSKENFRNSLVLTQNKWWIIAINIIFISFIANFAMGIIENIFSVFGISPSKTSSFFLQDFSKIDIASALQEFFGSKKSIENEIHSFIQAISSSIASIFIATFLYIFYLQLAFERKVLSEKIEEIPPKIQDTQETIIEL